MTVAWAGFWPIGRPCKTLHFFAEIALNRVDAVAFSPEAQVSARVSSWTHLVGVMLAGVVC